MADATASYSVNERAEAVMGRRLTPEQEATGVLPIDLPCELGYQCPVHREAWDEGLAWSEYRGFLWCERCNRGYPSALCVPTDGTGWNAGPEMAIHVFLASVEDAVQHRLAVGVAVAALLGGGS